MNISILKLPECYGQHGAMFMNKLMQPLMIPSNKKSKK